MMRYVFGNVKSMDLISQLSIQFQNTLASMNEGGYIGAGLGGAISTIPENPIIKGYHGSPSIFSEFDISKARAGAAGTGVYLTPEKNIASAHGGNIHEFSIPVSEKKIADFNKPIAEQQKTIKSSFLNLAKKHGLDIQPEYPASHVFNSLKNKLTQDIGKEMQAIDEVDAEKLYQEANKRASLELEKHGIKGANYFIHGDERYPATVLYTSKGLNIEAPKVAQNIAGAGEAFIKLDDEASKLQDLKGMAKNIGRYYAANPKEIAKGIGKGGALALAGAGVEYGLQKTIPEKIGSGYWQDVYSNLRDFGIAGGSGAVGGPLGASIAIGTEIVKKGYETGKEAADLVSEKIKSSYAKKGIKKRKDTIGEDGRSS